MEIYNNQICVTYADLIEGDNPIMSRDALRKALHRKTLAIVQRGGGEDTRCLIAYSSLKQRHKDKWIALYGDPEKALAQARKEEAERYTEDPRARAFYEEYKQCLNGVQTSLSAALIKKYTIQASVLNILAREHMKTIEATVKGKNPRSMKDIYLVTKKRSELLRKVVDHKLPKSYERFRETLDKYREKGYISLISEKVGNRNSQSISEEGKSLLIALKRSRTPVYTLTMIFEEYNKMAEARGWKPITTKRTISALLERPEIKPLWYDARMGEMAAHQKYDRKHLTDLPQMRDSLWYGDGTKLNLYYRDADGKVRTTQVYEVVDAYSECLLGYHISDAEDYWAQYHAFRMAVETSGHQPFEIVHDNQGGHKKLTSQDFFSRIAKIHRPTAPYNGQSKTIENIFGRMQQEVLSRRGNYTGGNITTKSERSKPNLEFVEANKHKLPTLSELKADYAEARKAWNALPHPATGVSREEMYRMSVNPDTQPVGKYEMIDMFWMTTEKPSVFTSNGIQIQIRGQKYHYEVLNEDRMPHLEWRRTNIDRKFYIKYDPLDMTSVRLYMVDDAGELRFSAIGEPPIRVHRAQQEQTAEDKAFLRAMQEANAKERVERVLAGKAHEFANGTAPEQYGYVTPKPKALPKDKQEQIQKQVRKLTREHGVVELGASIKIISNLTFGDLIDKKVVNSKSSKIDTEGLSKEELRNRALAKL